MEEGWLGEAHGEFSKLPDESPIAPSMPSAPLGPIPLTVISILNRSRASLSINGEFSKLPDE